MELEQGYIRKSADKSKKITRINTISQQTNEKIEKTRPVHGLVLTVSGLLPIQTNINVLARCGLVLHGLVAVLKVYRAGLG